MPTNLFVTCMNPACCNQRPMTVTDNCIFFCQPACKEAWENHWAECGDSLHLIVSGDADEETKELAPVAIPAD